MEVKVYRVESEVEKKERKKEKYETRRINWYYKIFFFSR